MVWHEIVNDRFDDGPLSVTYCPLTGSAVAFRGIAPGGDPYTFGTSGDLVNSNLLAGEGRLLASAALTGHLASHVFEAFGVGNEDIHDLLERLRGADAD